MNLRCYCCGTPIKSEITLVGYDEHGGADRVFTFLPAHAARADEKNTSRITVIDVKTKKR